MSPVPGEELLCLSLGEKMIIKEYEGFFGSLDIVVKDKEVKEKEDKLESYKKDVEEKAKKQKAGETAAKD